MAVGVVLMVWASGCAAGRSAKESPEAAETRERVLGHIRDGLNAKDVVSERQAYLEALKLDAHDAVARNNLGVCYMKEGQYYAAAQEFDLAMKLAPRAPEPHFNMGLLFEGVGKLEQASDSYALALELAPQISRYRVCLARTYVKRGTDEWRARRLLDEALKDELDPETIGWIRETQDLLERNRFDLEPLK